MIKLEENYYIDADEKCFMLKKKTINEKGKEVVTILGYYNSIQNAAKSYIKNEIRDNIRNNKIRSIHSLLKLLEELEEKINKKLNI